MHVAAMNPENGETLLAQPYLRDPSKSIEQLLKQTIAKVGENMKIARFARYQV